MPEARRAFLALWLPPALAQALCAHAARLAGHRLLPVDLHLTLAFLGDLDAVQRRQVTDLAQTLRLPAAALQFDRLEYWAHNRIVWAHLAQWPAPLVDFVETLRAGLREAGFALEARRFRPHVSLLRQAPIPAIASADAALGELPVWQVDGWCLAAAEAERRPATPRYVRLAAWPAFSS